MSKSLRLATIVSAAAIAATTITPAGAATGSGLSSSEKPEVTAASYNDSSCTPSEEHPLPVVLVHGTQDTAESFAPLAEKLKANGYCAYGYNYGTELTSLPGILPKARGVGDMNTSASQLADIIDKVKAETGSAKVDIVAHSQGATLAKMYMQENGGASNVNRLVSMGGTFHGTTLSGTNVLLRPLIDTFPRLARFFAGTGATQQVIGSPIINRLNTFPDTTAGVVYTSMYSPADTVATPNNTSHLEAVPGADVANVDIQQVCQPKNPVTHPQMPGSPITSGLVMWGLTRDKDQHSPSASDCGTEEALGSSSSS